MNGKMGGKGAMKGGKGKPSAKPMPKGPGMPMPGMPMMEMAEKCKGGKKGGRKGR